jgi:hypothetical protein
MGQISKNPDLSGRRAGSKRGRGKGSHFTKCDPSVESRQNLGSAGQFSVRLDIFLVSAARIIQMIRGQIPPKYPIHEEN